MMQLFGHCGSSFFSLKLSMSGYCHLASNHSFIDKLLSEPEGIYKDMHLHAELSMQNSTPLKSPRIT